MSTASFDSTGPGRFRVIGPMTFATVTELLKQSAGRFGQAERMEADLGQVGDSDSAGLALLIEWKRLAREKGSSITFTNTPPQLMALARISEVDELIGEPAAERTTESAAAG